MSGRSRSEGCWARITAKPNAVLAEGAVSAQTCEILSGSAGRASTAAQTSEYNNNNNFSEGCTNMLTIARHASHLSSLSASSDHPNPHGRGTRLTTHEEQPARALDELLGIEVATVCWDAANVLQESGYEDTWITSSE